MLDQKGKTFPGLAQGLHDGLKFDGLKQECQCNLQVIKKDRSAVPVAQAKRHRTGWQTYNWGNREFLPDPLRIASEFLGWEIMTIPFLRQGKTPSKTDSEVSWCWQCGKSGGCK